MNAKSYLLKNILKSIALLAIFALAFLFARRNLNLNYLVWFEPVYENTLLIFSIFLVSEIIIGIIPPEIFIIWALGQGPIEQFVFYVFILASISYGAGIMGYGIGYYLTRWRIYRFVKRKFLKKLDKRLKSFGIYFIILAALTPLPFSGVSMLIGSVAYSFKRFVMLALFRFLRFALYAVVFWETSILI